MHIAALLIGLGLALSGQDHQIGEVAGKPVYASQVAGSTDYARMKSLQSIFFDAANKAYYQAHKDELMPTAAEMDQMVVDFIAAKACRDPTWKPASPESARFAALFIGMNSRVQRYIYRHHGGGRLLFQQAGVEAWDATHQMLLEFEKQGAFTITDPEARELAFRYWTNESQPGIMDDPGPKHAFAPGEIFGKCPAQAADHGSALRNGSGGRDAIS